MADDPQEPSATALAELEQLRAENQRLRGLLGLDARPAADESEPVEVAEPTLFQSAPLGPAGKVDASSPQAAKLALFRSFICRPRGRARHPLGEPHDGRDGLVTGGARRLGTDEQGASRVPTADR